MSTTAGTVTSEATRRGRHSVRTGLLMLALAAGLIGVVYVLTVEPLGPGGVWYTQGFRLENANEPPTYSPRDILWADYAPAGTVRFGFGIRNATLVPVTVIDLPPWNDRFIVRQVSVGHDERGSSAYVRPLPITLAPGQMTILVVTAQFQNCQLWPAGGATGFDSMPVNVTVLAVPRQVNFPLPYQVRLKAADACP